MTSDDDSGAPRPRRRQVLRAATVTVLGAGVVTGTGAGILRALNSERRQRRRAAAAPDGRRLRGRDPREAAQGPGAGQDRHRPLADAGPRHGAGHDGRLHVARRRPGPEDPGPVPHQGRLVPVAARAVAPRPARPVDRRGHRQGRHLTTGRRAVRRRSGPGLRLAPARAQHHPASTPRRSPAMRGSSPAPPRGHCRARPRSASPCPASTPAPSGAPTRAGATDRRATTARSCRPTCTTAPPATATRRPTCRR